MESEPVVFVGLSKDQAWPEIREAICKPSPLLIEARWRRIAREAVAQLRKTADEIERELNG